MSSIAKWIGGGLGWALLGPLGAVVGFALGYFIDARPGLIKASIDEMRQKAEDVARDAELRAQGKFGNPPTSSGDFMASLLALVAAVLKADGKVRRVELDYIKRYFVQSFGEQTAQEAILMLRDVLKQDIPVASVARQIAQYTEYETRLQLLYLLFGISQADDELHPAEVKLIEQIAQWLAIQPTDYSAIRATYRTGLEAAYDQLGLSPQASNAQIKAAYRDLANKYHPDKVAYLGEEFRKVAEEKFAVLNNAYQTILRQRNL